MNEEELGYRQLLIQSLQEECTKALALAEISTRALNAVNDASVLNDPDIRSHPTKLREAQAVARTLLMIVGVEEKYLRSQLEELDDGAPSLGDAILSEMFETSSSIQVVVRNIRFAAKETYNTTYGSERTEEAFGPDPEPSPDELAGER